MASSSSALSLALSLPPSRLCTPHRHQALQPSPVSFLTATTLSSVPAFSSLVLCRKRPQEAHLRSRQSAGDYAHYAPIDALDSQTREEDGGREEEEQISRATLIWRAVKLPIYTVALIPLSVGSSVSYFQTGIFHAGRYFVLLFASIFIIVWLNLSNDVFDSDTGVDKNKKESVVNIVGSRDATLYAANVFLAAGLAGLIYACVQGGDLRAIALLIGSIVCGYVYQCPPFRLSYKGLGEPLCFLAFGPLATTAFYLSQGSKSEAIQLPLTVHIASASILVGLTTALILLCSHFHQVDEDRAVGKLSPLVRMGTNTGSVVVKALVVTLYVVLSATVILKTLPLSCLFLCMLTLPIGRMVINYVEQNHSNKIKIFMAKYYCVRLHTLFGAALTAGLVVARKMVVI
ncbi:2-carboxy-1,4-naphthoquinone phytyltransferase, chloroplastic [Nymphaea colorata]|nr:2-carboxy-1,4-naphthoquinone phytyltransferase, chloroplastic [Nymphaea colorata]